MLSADDEQGVSAAEHHRGEPASLRFVAMTVSDTRTPDSDRSGQLLVDEMQAAGHTLLDRCIVPDEPQRIVGRIRQWLKLPELSVILITGGTGVAPRDQTPEAVAPLLDGELPGFGELFRMLSYQEIGPAAMLSRAVAGRIGSVWLFCLPGSTAAVRLGLQKLLIPELPHLVHLTRGPREQIS